MQQRIGTDAEWREVLATCSRATFFHTPEWAGIFASYLPAARPVAHIYLLRDGTKALLPMVEYATGPGGALRRYESMAPGVYGGVLSPRQLQPPEAQQIYASLLGWRTTEVLVMETPSARSHALPGYSTNAKFTHMLDLTVGYEAIRAKYQRGVRNRVRQAQAKGLQLRYARSLGDCRRYFALYEAALARWGERATSRYGFDLFRRCFEAHCPDLKLWLVCARGEIVGGALIGYCQDHVVSWHSAYNPAYHRHGVSPFLTDETVRDACARGLKWYDLSPSGGHEGVAKFKDSFGAERLPVLVYSWKNRRLSALRGIRHALPRVVRGARTGKRPRIMAAPATASDVDRHDR